MRGKTDLTIPLKKQKEKPFSDRIRNLIRAETGNKPVLIAELCKRVPGSWLSQMMAPKALFAPEDVNLLRKAQVLGLDPGYLSGTASMYGEPLESGVPAIPPFHLTGDAVVGAALKNVFSQVRGSRPEELFLALAAKGSVGGLMEVEDIFTGRKPLGRAPLEHALYRLSQLKVKVPPYQQLLGVPVPAEPEKTDLVVKKPPKAKHMPLWTPPPVKGPAPKAPRGYVKPQRALRPLTTHIAPDAPIAITQGVYKLRVFANDVATRKQFNVCVMLLMRGARVPRKDAGRWMVYRREISVPTTLENSFKGNTKWSETRIALLLEFLQLSDAMLMSYLLTITTLEAAKRLHLTMLRAPEPKEWRPATVQPEALPVAV